MTNVVDTQADHRQRVLRALGVTLYGLRGRFRPDQGVTPADEAASMSMTAAADGAAACVLVLPGDCDARQRTQVEHIMQALGGVFAQAVQVGVAGGELTAEVPPAHAYLAFGEAQARALGRSLSSDAVNQAQVVLLDAPEALFDAAGKRRLWQAVGGLRRHWHDRAGRLE